MSYKIEITCNVYTHIETRIGRAQGKWARIGIEKEKAKEKYMEKDKELNVASKDRYICMKI